MKPISCRTVSAEICRVRIFLFGLHPVNLVVIRVEFVVVDFVAYYHAKQNEYGKPDNKICKVYNRENLVMPYIPKNVNKKMFNHCFCLFKFFISLIPQRFNLISSCCLSEAPLNLPEGRLCVSEYL